MKRLAVVLGKVEDTPPILWILSGFILSYLLFFFQPLFLAKPEMQLPPTLPIMVPIGSDLEWALDGARAWFAHGGSPYSRELVYTPVGYLLLWPLLQMESASRYAVISLITMAMYGLAVLALPIRVLRARGICAETVLVLATGATSYGLQFELERGQQNVIAGALALAAICIFHFDHRHRIWAYVLLSLAVQLKIWPAIFVLMLIRNWRDWKVNLRRLGLFGLVNVALLSVFLPASSILDFFSSIAWLMAGSDMIFVVNHSIHSFIFQARQHAEVVGYAWVAQNAIWFERLLLAGVAACMSLILLRAIRAKVQGFNPDLLLAVALAALLVPGHSQDYKLATLAGPVAIFLAGLGGRMGAARPRILSLLAVVSFSFAYSATLLPTAYKPHRLVLENNLPVLLVMLVALTVLAWSLAPSNGIEGAHTTKASGWAPQDQAQGGM